ncbi:hypothetical protein AB1E19_002294 [Capra hircus]
MESGKEAYGRRLDPDVVQTLAPNGDTVLSDSAMSCACVGGMRPRDSDGVPSPVNGGSPDTEEQLQKVRRCVARCGAVRLRAAAGCSVLAARGTAEPAPAGRPHAASCSHPETWRLRVPIGKVRRRDGVSGCPFVYLGFLKHRISSARKRAADSCLASQARLSLQLSGSPAGSPAGTQADAAVFPGAVSTIPSSQPPGS